MLDRNTVYCRVWIRFGRNIMQCRVWKRLSRNTVHLLRLELEEASYEYGAPAEAGK
jgi:hypothetical protein